MNPLTAIISPITESIGKAYTSYQERKKASETGKYKVRKAMLDSENKLDLSDSEWESISASKQDSSWKDEYVTLVVTLPIPLLLLGSLASAMGYGDSLLDGTIEGIKAINSLEGNLSEMMLVVVYAAVGLKLWRGK
jgi:hypothetical protein